MHTSMSSFRPRFSMTRRNGPLSEDEIRKVAPSVFAEAAHESRSARYTYIPTSVILASLQKEGFQVYSAAQARSRIEGRGEHTKHLIRMRHVGDQGRVLDVGESMFEICLLNSHDGSSSYQMFGGMFRLKCRNGLMVSESTLGAVKVPHTGKVQDRVVEGAFEILDGYTRVVDARDEMRGITLKPEEQLVLAESALLLRYDDPAKPAPILANRLLSARREEDAAPDLWTTFNRVQENVIRGGLIGRNDQGRPTSTRAITGIDQSVKVNRALWHLAERMGQIKAGH